MTASEELHAVAEKHLGTREVDGPRSNPTIVEWIMRAIPWMRGEKVDDSTTSWCGVFLSELCDKLKLPKPSQPYRAKNWLEIGQHIPWDNAQPGDIVVSSRGGGLFHVSLFDRWGDNGRTFWWSLGGNQRNAVTRAPYPRKWIVGIRRLVRLR